ncbi:hypothetical protein B0H21DRAFT_271900 [Amylocystis lapponica]|nr:hypothetical protein B0H21DRAFT_271900 [Amylocystis lapponica]
MPRRPSKAASGNILDFFGGGSSRPASQSSPTSKPATQPRKSKRKRARGSLSDVIVKDNAPADEEGSQSSDAGAIQFERNSKVIDLTDEDEQPSPRPSPAKRRNTRRTRADSDEDADVIEISSPTPDREVLGAVSSKGSKGKGKAKAVVDDSDEEEVQPRRRRLVRGVRPPSPEEDEADILEEVDEHRIIEPRMRQRNKKSAFQRNLEILKKKKRGEVAKSESASESSDDEDNPAPFAHAKPDNGGKSDSSEDEADEEAEDTFIIEDDDAVVELPPEFSMESHQDLIHHFKIICQLFVHLAVQKPVNRPSAIKLLLEKDYFSVPLRMTRRKLIGMRDSLVTSSVWRPDFKKPLEKYPELEVVRMDFAIPECDACHLGGRMSTLLGRVSGIPYDRSSFGPLDDESSDEDDETAKEKKEFNLGRFCAARTRVFHSFTHWEYKLFEALCQEVDELRISGGTRGFVRVAYAKGRKPPKDVEDADGIMEWLDERKIIDMEWHKVKEMMESARNLEKRAGKDED